MIALASADSSFLSLCSAEELVQRGFCDPVRIFVKTEPHPINKISEGRFRLISSVSLIDQIVERLIFGPQNTLEIAEWEHIPSKPGMGLALRRQQKSLFADLAFKHNLCPAAEADISGFDWTVQDWELWTDAEMRCALGGFPEPLRRACKARFYCLMMSVFQLSNGTLISQRKPGVMKSGSYLTSSTNSRIRCLMAQLIGAPWCIAMGDDSVEGFVDGAPDKYAKLGHICKEYRPCEVDDRGQLKSVGFCSHRVLRETGWLETWPKTLFRHLSSKQYDYSDIELELRNNPQWPRIKAYLDRVRPPTSSNKIDLNRLYNGSETDESPASHSHSEHPGTHASNGWSTQEWTHLPATRSPEECPWQSLYGRCKRAGCQYGHFARY